MTRIGSPTGIVLVLALAGSNLAWVYLMANQASAVDGCQSSYSRACGALRESVALMPALAKNQSRDEVIAAARARTSGEMFEKEGSVVVGDLAFQFAKNGQLESVSPTTYPLCDPPVPEGAP